MPICEGLRRVDRADSRRPSPAMPLLLSAHLQAARAQAWAGGKGEVNGARGGAGGRHPRRGFVRGLPVAEHCSTPTAQPPHSRQLPLGAPSSCCSAPRQLLTAPQPPSPPLQQPGRVAPPAAPQAPRRGCLRPRCRFGLRGSTPGPEVRLQWANVRGGSDGRWGRAQRCGNGV